MKESDKLKKQLDAVLKNEAEEAHKNKVAEATKYVKKAYKNVIVKSRSTYINYKWFKEVKVENPYNAGDPKRILLVYETVAVMIDTAWRTGIEYYRRGNAEFLDKDMFSYDNIYKWTEIPEDEWGGVVKAVKALTKNLIAEIDDGKIKPLNHMSGVEYTYHNVREKQKHLLDLPHIKLEKREPFLIGETIFRVDDLYIISPQSIKYAIEVLERKAYSDQDSTRVLSAMGYRNRHDESAACYNLINKLENYEKYLVQSEDQKSAL